jgi:ferrochelatase
LERRLKKTAVLLLAYGGPNSLDDVPAYLRNVRSGQPVSQSLLDETIRRYRLIGGRSPLLDITRRLASRVQSIIDLPVYVGMRHWHPYIAETVPEMVRDGIEHIVAICLAPHYSPMSVGAYRTKLDEAVRGSGMQVSFVAAWHTQAQYIAGIAQNVRATLAQLPSDAKIIFTAHSLPVSVREPYETQLRETAQLVAQNLSLRQDRWLLCYQSKPRAGGDWLEPHIENLIPQLARDGEKNLLIAPIGFLADHLEVLYDLDIAVPEIARANDVRVARTPMLNDSDALVNALAELVREQNAQYKTRDT